MIPIQNIYYMLSYAFRALTKSEFNRIETESFANIYDMYSSILIKATETLLKRGMHKEYLYIERPTSTPRGKLLLMESIKQQSLYNNKLVCGYDVFTENIPLNQMIKATLFLLLSKPISIESKKRIKTLLLYFSEVNLIGLHMLDWNRCYAAKDIRWNMVVSICKMIQNEHKKKKKSGCEEFADFSDEQQLSALFERFVREYFRKEYPQLNTSSPIVRWKLDSPENEYLPNMHTDVVLSTEDNVLVIDTKFYSQIMHNRYGKKIIRPDHMYQIYSYVKNMMSHEAWSGKTVSGMLLYAKTDEGIDIDKKYDMDGNRIYVKTLDLNLPFADITKQMGQITMNVMS